MRLALGGAIRLTQDIKLFISLPHVIIQCNLNY